MAHRNKERFICVPWNQLNFRWEMIITIQLLRVEFMSILPTYKCVETTKDYGTTKSRVA